MSDQPFSELSTQSNRSSGEQDRWPPMPLDGPAFVVIHESDNPSQTYGQTYSFTGYAIGERSKLVTALQAFQAGGPPVYLILYRPSPHSMFTAWARVRAIHEEPSGRPDDTGDIRWTLALDQREFPVSLNLKGNAQSLTTSIPWLANGLMPAFNGYTIRQIEPGHFLTLIAAARQARADPLEPEIPWVPTIYATPDANFWRIHFPRSLWHIAYQHGIIAVDFPDDSTDQSLKRFRRIRAGDRVVAYVQGGTIGSIGVVIQAYQSDEPLTGAAAALFSGGYRQRLRVAWAEATFARLTIRLDQPPAETTRERRNGYATLTVTATEDWGVRDVVGGIAPQSKRHSLGVLPYLRRNEDLEGNWQCLLKHITTHWNEQFDPEDPDRIIRFDDLITRAIAPISLLRNIAAHTDPLPRSKYTELQNIIFQNGKLGYSALNALLLGWPVPLQAFTLAGISGAN